MKKHRFSKPQVLKRIDRELLRRFLASFQDELEREQVQLPEARPGGEDYCHDLAQVLMSPEGLPDRLNEALTAIDEMATASGQEELELAVAKAGVRVQFAAESSPEDIALQVWLAAPELLVRKHNERRLLRLEIFECFRSGWPVGTSSAVIEPDQSMRAALTAALNPWFESHNRGERTTRIETYWIQEENWFLVRHGDTFTRRPKVEQQKTALLHFRPERDDVIVYSPRQDEIRVNARTRGEKELYRRKFGLVLHGDENYFRALPTYTLDPLRTDGAAALDSDGLEGIARITLREIQVAVGDAFQRIVTTEAADIFACAAAGEGEAPPIPEDGQLTRAAFELEFAESSLLASVQIRPPNILKLGRHCDIGRVTEWLSKRGFRA
jgi:hypothetical protein